MPPLESLDRYEDALLWNATGENDEHGDPTVNETPVEIKVRIVRRRKQSVNPEGNTIGIDAMVHSDRAIAIGSRLWEGTLDEWTGTGSGDTTTKVWYVATDETALDIKGRSRRYQYGLVRNMATI